MAKIVLDGCSSTPLSGYLKALGVLRLLAEQSRDKRVRAYWEKDVFILDTSLTQDDICWFFLNQYQPTPLVAPWNASTGFYAKDRDSMKATLQGMRDAGCDRLKVYRESVITAQKAVDDLGLNEPKDGKDRLLKRLRNTLPDEAVRWLDTCALIGSDDLRFPPLTGTGGNDGNFEFSRSFMQQLQELFDFETGEAIPAAAGLLKVALFGEMLPGLPFNGPIGQFNPIAAGGVNATSGYMAEPRVNPWEYVLMLEGIVLFTAAVTRRYESNNDGSLTYPFMVRPSLVGYGSAADDNARAELWAPLWSQAVGVKELQVLFNEGRAKLGGRTARDGVDFVRAIASRGVARGITAFERYSFQERNGLAYFAIPLGRVEAKPNASVDRLVAIDPWRDQFRRMAQDENAPKAIKSAARRLETVLYEFSVGKVQLVEVLIALGEAEKALSRSMKFTIEKGIRPLVIRDWRWISEANDQSVEFRMALALAANGLRERLVAVRKDEKKRLIWSDKSAAKTIWTPGQLEDNLITWLRRDEIETLQRTRESSRDAPSDEAAVSSDRPSKVQPPVVRLADIRDWIHDQVNSKKLEAIARGLCLINLEGYGESVWNEDHRQMIWPPASYALLKVVHHRKVIANEMTSVFGAIVMPEDIEMPRVAELLGALRQGDGQRATRLAVQGLRASRFKPATPIAGIPGIDRDSLPRIASALAFPISNRAIAQLLYRIHQVVPEDTKEEKARREAALLNQA
jgi:CRISPR-associated protein Csx17